MPRNELEQHPYLIVGESILATKMIVGTFPIYALTNPRSVRKNQLAHERRDMSFFYGSKANAFWRWYQQYVDNAVNIQLPGSIITSLTQRQIAISDVINQCSRVDESFEDNDLRRKQWNYNLAKVIEGRIGKIICTSKASSGALGWLINRILLPAGYTIDSISGQQLHLQILNSMPNSNNAVLPVAYVLKKGLSRVSLVALPSPGSPERRLVNFGYVKDVHDTAEYLNGYLSSVFEWFYL